MDKTKNFIEKAKKIHGDKYDYSKTLYKRCDEKVIIICKLHGEFEETPRNHLDKRTKEHCPKCNNRITPNRDNFIERANIIHSNKYSYDKVGEIKRVKDIVTITCPIHGDFDQEVNSHLQGRGCPYCSGKKFSIQDYLKKANNIWNNKYDYSKFEWKGVNEKVCIICPEHGEFWQLPNNHLKGECGCPQCRGKSKDYKTIYDFDDFLELAHKKYGNKFDYSKVVWKGSREKICIICPIHGEFWVLPYGFLQNTYGCPECNPNAFSKKEILIESILNRYKIPHKQQFELITEEVARNINLLRVDFFIKYKGKQYFIEYNGEQHYKFCNIFHKTEEDFIKQQRRDQVLRDFCNLHNDKVKLLEIPYTVKESEIEQLILKFINYYE